MPAKPGPLSPKRVRPLGLSALSASPPPGRGDSRVSPSDALAPRFRFKIASLGGINAKSEATSKTRKWGGGVGLQGGFGGLRNAPVVSFGGLEATGDCCGIAKFSPVAIHWATMLARSPCYRFRIELLRKFSTQKKGKFVCLLLLLFDCWIFFGQN